ncbi:MAG TPA: hypothetical protein DD706_11830 [Nitrospiraceae bacterium]|nr:hypothetical protein [Nitrospiraceae bacterium]
MFEGLWLKSLRDMAGRVMNHLPTKTSQLRSPEAHRLPQRKTVLKSWQCVTKLGEGLAVKQGCWERGRLSAK